MSRLRLRYKSPWVYRRRRPTCARTECAGSIDKVGGRFQSFGINNLEMVDQNIASWNRLANWLRRVEVLLEAV